MKEDMYSPTEWWTDNAKEREIFLSSPILLSSLAHEVLLKECLSLESVWMCKHTQVFSLLAFVYCIALILCFVYIPILHWFFFFAMLCYSKAECLC